MYNQVVGKLLWGRSNERASLEMFAGRRSEVTSQVAIATFHRRKWGYSEKIAPVHRLPHPRIIHSRSTNLTITLTSYHPSREGH